MLTFFFPKRSETSSVAGDWKTNEDGNTHLKKCWLPCLPAKRKAWSLQHERGQPTKKRKLVDNWRHVKACRHVSPVLMDIAKARLKEMLKTPRKNVLGKC